MSQKNSDDDGVDADMVRAPELGTTSWSDELNIVDGMITKIPRKTKLPDSDDDPMEVTTSPKKKRPRLRKNSKNVPTTSSSSTV
jgi:hypothetical protein